MTTPSNHNPYQPPKADVSPRPEEFESGELVEGGQSVPVSNAMQWIAEAFKLFGKSPGIWILNFIIVIVLSIVMAFIPIIGSIASNLLMPVIFAGIMLGCRSLDSGGELKVEHLFAGFKEKTGQLILIGVFYLVAAVLIFIAVAVVAIVFFGGGLLQAIGDQRAITSWFLEQGIMMILVVVLLTLALFLPLAMAYWFAPALVVFHDMDAISAMKASFIGGLRNILPFLLYSVVLLVLMIIAVIPFGLGLLVFGPVVTASLYTSYKDIYLKQ